MPDDPSPIPGATPSNYRRTTGGNLQWKPPSVEHLQQLLSGYEVIEMLGAGGMGAVYKARQLSLDRMVAIKILPPEAAGDEEANFVERFRNEARTMAKMNHPAIVSVYDFGETSEGQLYIVMEFVDGTDVSKMILSQGKLPPEYALAITAHVCDALQYAHTHGVIHRDIKPANVLINMEGQVKVADFGLAKASDTGQGGLTKTNMAMGTPDFVAPEALITGMTVDGRADLYAVGVMLYNMLTGNVPRGMFRMPSTTLNTDPRFDKIITKSMEMDRDMRYQTAFDIRKDLDVILSTPRVEAGGQSSAAIPKRQLPQKPVSRGPQKPMGKSAKVPVRSSQSAPQDLEEQNIGAGQVGPQRQKTNLGPVIGIAATGVIGVGLFFMFKPRPPVSDNPTTAEVAAQAPARAEPAKPVSAPQSATPPAARAPETAETPSPPPAGTEKQTIDLLALTDPMKDRVLAPPFTGKNEWAREGAALVFRSDGKSGKIAAPVAFNCRDYEIELLAERLSGTDRIHTDVPLAKGRILPLVFNSQGRKVINEKKGNAWPAPAPVVHVSVRVMISGDGKSDRIVIVRKDNGETLADWTGSMDEIGKPGEAHPVFPGQPVTSVFVMAAPYSVKTWKLRVFEGEAQVLRESAAPPVMAAVPQPASLEAPPAAGLVAAKPAMPAPPLPEQPPAINSPPSTDPRLAQLAAGFKARYEADAQKPFLAAVATLNQSYVANGIGRARAAAQQKGALEEVTALDAEKARIQSGQPLPPADLETLPESLKGLRATYRSALAKIEADRAQKAAPLYDLYIGALNAYITELTKANKIDDAQKVKTLRDDIAAQKPQVDAAVATPASRPAPGSAKTAKAQGIAPAPGRSRWYEAARWVVSVGGFVNADNDGRQIRIEKVADIPPGKFEVLDVSIDGNPQSNTITDDDFTRLSGLKELRSLRVAGIQVGDAAFAFLPTTPAVTSIVIAGIPVTDAVLSHLAPLKNLTDLQVQSAPQFTGAGLEKLSSLPMLRTVWFSSAGFNDAGARALARAPNLTAARLDSTKLTDEGVAALGRMPRLADVSFAQCADVRGTGLAQWENVPALRVLYLNGTKLGPDALPIVARLTGLTTLGLDSLTMMNDETLAALAPLKGLEQISAAATSVTGTGFSFLRGCTQMKSIQLQQDTPVSGAGLAAIAAAFPKLEDLRLGRTTALNGADLFPLAALKFLKHLEIPIPNLDETGMKSIGQISPLESLYIDGSAIPSQSIAGLKPLKLLTRLALINCPNIDDTAVPLFKDLKGLTTLEIRGTAITDAGLATLQKALPRCQISR